MGTVAPSYKKVFVVLLCILTKLRLGFVNTEYHDKNFVIVYYSIPVTG